MVPWLRFEELITEPSVGDSWAIAADIARISSSSGGVVAREDIEDELRAREELGGKEH